MCGLPLSPECPLSRTSFLLAGLPQPSPHIPCPWHSPLRLPAHGSLSSFLSLRAPLFCVEVTFSSPCLIAFLPLHAEPREQGGSGEHITNMVTASEEQEAAPERGLSAFCFFYPYLPSAAFFLWFFSSVCLLLWTDSLPSPFSELLHCCCRNKHRGTRSAPRCLPAQLPRSLTPGITLLETLLLSWTLQAGRNLPGRSGCLWMLPKELVIYLMSFPLCRWRNSRVWCLGNCSYVGLKLNVGLLIWGLFLLVAVRPSVFPAHARLPIWCMGMERLCPFVWAPSLLPLWRWALHDCSNQWSHIKNSSLSVWYGLPW